MRSVRRTRRPLVALVALLVALAVGYAVRAVDPPSGRAATPSSGSPSSGSPSSGSPSGSSPGSPSAGSVGLSTLPPQAADTVRLIGSGGPFPYPRNDGVVFHNDEGHLPHEADGYYREYTVPTPGSADRGARRIITGGGRFYYTGDHYETFVLVDVHR